MHVQACVRAGVCVCVCVTNNHSSTFSFNTLLGDHFAFLVAIRIVLFLPLASVTEN